MIEPLTEAEVFAVLDELRGWTHEDNALAKIFHFTTFRDAISFMVRVSFVAEAMDHHPDWSNVYTTVKVRLRTHDAGNRVTARDVALAKKVQQISWVG